MKYFIILLAAVCMAAASPAQVREDGKPPRLSDGQARKCECKHPKKMKKHKHIKLPPCPPRKKQEAEVGVN